MKRVFLFLVILTLVPLSFGPVSSAQGPYSWEEIAGFELGDTAETVHQILPDYGGTVEAGDQFFSFANTGNDVANTWAPIIERCDLTDCEGSTGLGSGTAANQPGGHVNRLSDTLMYGCYAASTSAVPLTFAKSTNGGALWSTVAVSATNARNCDVETFDGSHYAMVWSNGTATDWVVSLSSDGGQTWPVTYLVEAETAGQTAANGVSVMAWSDTEYTALISDPDTSNFNSCSTSNSGVTWTCSAGVIATAFTINKERFNDDYYFTWTGRATGSDTAGFGFQGGINDGLAKTNAYDVSDGGSSVCASDIAVFTSERVGVALVKCVASASAALVFAESFDSGASGSWAVETIAVAPFTPNDATAFSVGAAYSDTGDVFAQWQFQTADGTTCGVADGDAVVERCFYAYSNTGETSVGAAATALVTNLVGFDVDRIGTNVIARTNSGTHVRTFIPDTLTEAANVDTECTGAGSRVFAEHFQGKNPLVAYVMCDTGDPTHLHIRTGSLQVPSSQVLNNADPGAATIALNDGSSTFGPGGDDLGELDEVASFPIDYSEEHRGTDTNGAWYLAWGWTSRTTTGNNEGLAGVNSFTNRQAPAGAADSRRFSIVQASSSLPTGYCTGMDGDTPYMAVGTNEGTKIYVLTPNFEDVGTLQHDALNFTITLQSTRNVPSGDVACGAGFVVVQETNNVHVRHRNGTTVANIPFTTPKACMAISERATNGIHFAYCNENTWEVRQLYDADEVFTNVKLGEGVTPTGTIVGGEADRAMQDYYIGTSTQIVRFRLGGGVVEEASTSGGEVVVPDTDGGGLFGGSGATIGAAFGTGAFGGNLFLGAVLMGIVAYGVGTGYGNTEGTRSGNRALRVNPWAAAVGGVVGFLMAWGFGFFSTAVVFSLVALVGIVIGVRVWVSRGG